ncbi:hypothetical protein N7E02_25360 [Aliirhizobium terrae]|uniref:hypothetical protein n=1 Tax=Terrirhizobium terrae TaxID=2926709 RepID=UPI002577A440|nr:hypothetical protein [Rhizobium sp. CC-CFT758]WJH39966.1 hypothetical protein N7E02_25360 [Rhizobium sp. CC-CFT758]
MERGSGALVCSIMPCRLFLEFEALIAMTKKWLVIAGCVWALLAFVAWHYESTCGVFFSGACFAEYWIGVRYLVLGKWIYHYQTLIGGVAALAAGAFVLIAAKQTSRDALQLSHIKRRQDAIVACSIISGEFRDAWAHLGKVLGSQMMVARTNYTPFTQFPSYIPTLHAVDPLLGSVASAVKRDAESLLLSGSNADHVANANLEAARCIAMSHIVEFASNNLNSVATFSFQSDGPKVPGIGVSKLMRAIGVSPDRLIGLYSFFDWEK